MLLHCDDTITHFLESSKQSFLLQKMLFVLLQFLFVFIRSGLGVKQTFFHRKVGQYLPDSVITTKYAECELECSVLCTIHKGCLSVNYKVRGLDQGLCQLNNNTISEKVGVTDDHFVYLAIAVWVSYFSLLLKTFRFFILTYTANCV